MTEPARLDRHLVDSGTVRSRTRAQELVREGRVSVDGRVVSRPGHLVRPGQHVTVVGEVSPWVGRGALKLDHAFTVWGRAGLSAAGRRCLDVGASTGGFTQVLLAHGATHVTALDVGQGQLVEELRSDARVHDLPGTNVRDVTSDELGGRFDLLVSDLSFISLTTVLPTLADLVTSEADLVLLVKPQFEAGPAHVGKGGVVRSARARAQALASVVASAEDAGLAVRGLERSPVTGTHGNTEYLLWLSPGAPGMMSTPDPAGRIAELTAEEEA